MENKSMATFQQADTGANTSGASATAGNLTTTLRRKIYAWHRTIGLVTIIPVIFWCLSGLMHPFLSHWFKPTIAREVMMPKTLDKAQITLSLQEVLTRNKVADFKNFRMVAFNGQTFYQVKGIDGYLRYYSAATGELLQDGDKKYAEFMARYFLDDQQSAITSVTQQKEFNQQYKYVNRYLPVWKVSFDRPDGMDVYIETASSRLGTFNTTSRKAFLWVFDNFHNWAFIGNITNNTLRITIMVALLGVILASAVTGIVIYGLFWRRFKKLSSATEKKGIRKYHRQIGVATAFITLTFTFSGAFHATRKLEPNVLPEMAYEPAILTRELTTVSLALDVDWERLHNLSIVRKSKHDYFQAFYLPNDDEPAQTVYIDAVDGMVWQNGDIAYAKFLGKKFLAVLSHATNMTAACCEEMGDVQSSGVDQDATLLKAEIVPKFESREYGFVFKRLPVVRLQYDTPDDHALYIETATSRLAASIGATDRIEGYSFAIFHKFLLMDWAGKNVRDIMMLLSAFGVLTVSVLGVLVFLRKA
ncbi:PepSY domain-containing protein [Parachryseolinea silvisoli]|uniref:PepSY domain-containing protein n=1 Tax=Parachryseolinea silvisoli TaxID=2873601 RepID=UPI002265BCB3|nr:PepSY domain-containing protein [Parachryseolinea silvisoli]MCD9014131.1 PepSY domain-containing protein [Parachryseolinea silvisoli]